MVHIYEVKITVKLINVAGEERIPRIFTTKIMLNKHTSWFGSVEILMKFSKKG